MLISHMSEDDETHLVALGQNSWCHKTNFLSLETLHGLHTELKFTLRFVELFIVGYILNKLLAILVKLSFGSPQTQSNVHSYCNLKIIHQVHLRTPQTP